MRPRTLLGLLVITAAGVALAWLFRASGEPSDAATASTHGATPAPTPVAADDHSRGRIVPLMVDDGFTGTAFIGAGGSDFSAAPRREDNLLLAMQPTIRRRPSAKPAASPQLGASFPRPLGLLGITSATEQVKANVDYRSVRPTPIQEDVEIEEAIPGATLTTSHVIVDGDTLPALAQQYLGSTDRAQEIYDLNRDRLPSLELLPIGLEIALPQP